MPNIITHTIFAQEVFRKEKNAEIASVIERNPHLYAIGSNGPDFLFFSHIKPWEAYRSHTLNHLGSRMHAEHINDFYTTALACIRKQTVTAVRKDMTAYLFGHLCHWALDMIAHPYVFYCTGSGKGKNAGYHHRMESMIDAYALRHYRNESIREWHCYDTCTFDEDMLKAIARIYVPIAREVYHTDVKVYDLRETLRSWRDVQKMLYDPKGRRYKAIHSLEKALRQQWKISGSIIPSKVDERYDVMNERKRFWLHPCDDQIASNASFYELFDEAIDVALQAIDAAWRCIVEGADPALLCHVLKDRAYDTGMSGQREMKHFRIIFEEE